MPERVALETTVFVHGLPRDDAAERAAEIADDVRGAGGDPTLVGVIRGRPVVGMSPAELEELLQSADVRKLNSSNLGLAMSRAWDGATTVSATIELAASRGIRLFATGGIGGVHRDLGARLDISADLAALSRFPMAVVTSGAKSILDVPSTREILESLGVPVVGFGTDEFPAFYLRGVPEGSVGIDARFDDASDLAAFIRSELTRTGRGVVVCNPIPEGDALDPSQLARWLEQSEEESNASGAARTPEVLGRVHEISGGATVRANIALLRSNARLAGRIAAAL